MRKLGWSVLVMLALGASAAWAQEPFDGPGDGFDGVPGEELLVDFDLGAAGGPGPGPMMRGDAGMECDGPGMMDGACCMLAGDDGRRGGRGAGCGRTMRGGPGAKAGACCMMGGGDAGRGGDEAMGAGPGMACGRPGMMRGRPGAGPGGPGMRGMRGLRGAMLEELKLTTAQREKMADLRDGQMRAGIRARADLRLAGLDLGKLMRAEKPDKSAIDAAIDGIARTRAELRKSRVLTLLEMRSLLTPEQREKLRSLRESPAAPAEGAREKAATRPTKK